MLALGVFYVIQEAPFLGAVQIIVYTGAIMILFLFVLMLVGRDSSRLGRRDAARAAGRRDRPRASASPALVGAGHRPGAAQDTPVAGLAAAERRAAATSPAIAELLFTKYLFAFEVTWRC